MSYLIVIFIRLFYLINILIYEHAKTGGNNETSGSNKTGRQKKN